MKDLLRQIQLNIQSQKLFSGSDKVVIGISGGVDSITLADLLVRYFKNPSNNIVLAHVDYKQRGEDISKEENDLIAKFAQKNNLAFEITEYVDSDVSGFENKAREFRYQFFKDVASKYNSKKIILAHHADDQTETILLKLARGGDWTTFSGMSFERNFDDLKIIRPLLNVSKKQIIDYAKINNLNWVEDASNFDPDYAARNLIRNEIIPKLQMINQNASINISEFGSFISDLENNKLPELLRIWIKEKAPELPIKNSQLQDFAALLENQKEPYGSIDLQDGYILEKSKDEINLKTPKTPKKQ